MRTTFAAAIFAAIAIGPVLALPAHAAGGTTTTQLSQFNAQRSGPRVRTGDGPPYFAAGGPVIGRDVLGADGYATFTTTVRTYAYAANWSTDGMSEAVGFLRDDGTPTEQSPLASPAHDGDPIVWMQFNSGTAGYCTNNKFMQNGQFVFGDGGKCGTVPGRTAHTNGREPDLKWTVTVRGSGAYQGTLELISNGSPVATQSFSGKVPGWPATEFVPMVRVRVGSDTGDKMPNPGRNWQFAVMDSAITVHSVDPGPSPHPHPHVMPIIRTGFGGMAAAVAEHRPANLPLGKHPRAG